MNSGYHSTTSQSEELNESERQEREKKNERKWELNMLLDLWLFINSQFTIYLNILTERKNLKQFFFF